MKEDAIKEILNSNMRYLFLASLVSADNNYDKESILKHLEILNAIKSMLNDGMMIENIDEIVGFIDKGLEILNKDLKEYK